MDAPAWWLWDFTPEDAGAFEAVDIGGMWHVVFGGNGIGGGDRDDGYGWTEEGARRACAALNLKLGLWYYQRARNRPS